MIDDTEQDAYVELGTVEVLIDIATINAEILPFVSDRYLRLERDRHGREPVLDPPTRTFQRGAKSRHGHPRGDMQQRR